ncbi:MAG: lipoyl synthase [Cyanobacteria bacterium P01_H01_bin.74]
MAAAQGQPPLGKPHWLKIRPPSGEKYLALKKQASQFQLATVCQEARCPNIAECWGGGTATFMIMGDTCTRGCRFCAVKTGNPRGWLDDNEPEKLASVIAEAGWQYVVLTSVDRDDLPDGGAAHFSRCIQAITKQSPQCIIETLIPDFQDDAACLTTLLNSSPQLKVVAHNIETVDRLTKTVRDRRAGYRQSLSVLKAIKQASPARYTKSSLMLGLGETDTEIRDCLGDLRENKVDIITFGQYLQPTKYHFPVKRFVSPDEFKHWKIVAEQEFGFLFCASGPLVRSSYRAGELFIQSRLA